MVKVEQVPGLQLFKEGASHGFKLALIGLAVLTLGAFSMLGGLLFIHVITPAEVWRLALTALQVLPIFGAVTVPAVAAISGFIRSNTKVFDVTATADADTTATIPHTLGVVPDEVFFMPTDAGARLSLWIETLASRDATNVVLTKATTGGSGVAGVQLRVYVKKPHTIVR